MSRKSNRFVVPLLALAVLLASCAQFFQGKIAIDMEMTDTKLSDLIEDKEEITQLPAPGEIYVSQGLSSDTVFVSWSKISGASYYRIERAIVRERAADGSFVEPDEEEFEVINKFVYGTSYNDLIIPNPSYKNSEYGYGYFYRVSAENPGKKYEESDYVVSAAGTLFAPVTEISATQGEDTAYIKVSWAKTAGASSYRVFRTAYSDGSGSAILSSVPANQDWYTDSIDTAAQGTEFYYSVYAVNSGGQTTPVSPVALGYSLVEGAPGRVSNVEVAEGRGETTDSIKISWEPVAATGDGDVTYSVYRTSSEDSASTLLTDKCKDAFYEDKKSLSPNVYYYYQVLAYTIDEDTGARLKGPISLSSVSDKKPAEGFILSAPSSLSVVHAKEEGKCSVTFPAAIGSKDYPHDSGASTSYNSYVYKIYGSDVQSGNYTHIATFDDATLTAEIGYYTVTVDAAKFYRVSTSYSNVEAAETDSSLGSVAAPAPYQAENLVATQHAYIQYVTDDDKNANSNGVYPVKVTWEEPAGGADGGYYIYRSTKADSGFRKVNDIPLTATEYIDSYDAAKPGTLYYYRVLSLNSLQQGANYSNVATGWGALTADQYMREYNKTIKNSHKKLTYMNKSNDLDKLGEETKYGDISGSVEYSAKTSGLGARIIMKYTDYAEFYIMNDSSLGVYFKCTGNTNTSASMDASGEMDGTMNCEGMYPGAVGYGEIKIKGGGAGGGVYVITREGFPSAADVSWTVGEE